LQIPLKEGTGGERRGENRVTLQITRIAKSFGPASSYFEKKPLKGDPYFDKNIKQLGTLKDPERMNSSTLTHFLWQRKAFEAHCEDFFTKWQGYEWPNIIIPSRKLALSAKLLAWPCESYPSNSIAGTQHPLISLLEISIDLKVYSTSTN
jgi:hypothetical protein